jgi:hypothetical protein
MDHVQEWYKDLKYPSYFSLDRYLSSPSLRGAKESMRQRSENNTEIYCELYHKTWCDLCFKRISYDGTTLHRDVKNKPTLLLHQ